MNESRLPLRQIENHDDGFAPCIGTWCCGCDEHPIGKPWGWNYEEWNRHFEEAHPSD